MHEKRFNAEIGRLRSAERLERLEIDRVIGLSLEGLPVTSVLDVGTGSGVFAEAFSKKELSVTGIDANPDMIKVAKELVPGLAFQQATVEMMPFADASFDLVFLGLVLHEADDLERALRECKRCARYSVNALEWGYKQEEAGPPIEHRLKSDDVVAMATKVGFKKVTMVKLKTLLLYQFIV